MKVYELATAAIVLALLFAAGNAAPTCPPQPPTPPPPANHPAINVTLKAVSPSNETGLAVLTDTSDLLRTTVSVTLGGAPPRERQYLFFQYGTCHDIIKGVKKPGMEVFFPLVDVVYGKSQSTYDMQLNIIALDGPGDGNGLLPGGSGGPPNGARPRPTTWALTVWRYTTSGKTLLSCGEHQEG